MAVFERDPACLRLIQPMLYFKGYQAVQAYRVGHWLWQQGRRDLLGDRPVEDRAIAPVDADEDLEGVAQVDQEGHRTQPLFGLPGNQPTPQAAQPATPFQPARHAQDEWFDKLPGKHRVILDVTSAEGSTWGIAYATNIYNASRTGYQIENADLAMVLCLRHSATSFAFNNAMWAKYGKVLDSKATPPPLTNPYDSGERRQLSGLAKRGVQFMVCGSASEPGSSVARRSEIFSTMPWRWATS